MSIVEKAELMLIGFVVVLIGFIHATLPSSMPISYLVLYGSALLLLQSLLRDLWYLFQSRHKKSIESKVTIQGMCLESTIGGFGIVLAVILSLTGLTIKVMMLGWLWLVLVAGVLVLGFLIKDLVIEWSPCRIRRDKNHMNIVFSWRKPGL